MSDSAVELKNKGNAAFSAKNYEEAVKYFTEAIALQPNEHTFYSNRSACYSALDQYALALEDGRKTIQLKPDWSKGYLREATALLNLNNAKDALVAVNKGLELEPSNKQLQDLKEDIQDDLNPPKGLFGPDTLVKLAMDPRTRDFVSQPDFVKAIQEIQADPKNLGKHISDKRITAAMGVVLGINLSTAGDGDFGFDQQQPGQQSSYQEPPKPKPAEPKPKPAPVVVEVTEGQKEREKGNACYKDKKFEQAISHYDKAYELDDKDLLSLNNKAAVYLEMGRVQDCIDLCKKATERASELRADYKIKAKILTRLGNAYMRSTPPQLDDALKAYKSAIIEDKNAETMANVSKCEKLKRERDEREYINPEKSAEAKNQGNEHFKKGEYPEAIKCFEEAIKRNPSDHTIYSNRSACYSKLGEYPLAVKDAEKVIELAPTFIKGYIRKGSALFAMGEYQNTLEMCDQGLRIEEDNKELTDLSQRAIFAINRKQSEMSDEERLQDALKNPEIAEILQDPIMNQILKDMQGNPAAVQEHLKNPGVRAKFEKLVKAGVVRLGR
ncbi:tetratricopeptide-like helical domain-containing protein [Cavenderia fasciculata]|uniref:Tetratricopeptide-like helical domain-containing protein n=1 Tax=Cavenderia fasciculata TaxID=261658 RepID=F4PTU2_CACFS|nr:tetratricopeptide-like helical domain-containing protein [Cavenderia fasciculata]EGG20921.1 tetratricopeptide-like helical domain-containing protein [Cavenderia fasciculata]|eukprot:XP_004358771.1 tetratricopeptide-like helical domain-containing protein [Cavenderia fasciculata]